MTQTLSSYLLGQKNKLHTDLKWLVLVECPIPALSKTFRFVDDHEIAMWNGNIYFPAKLFITENLERIDGSLESVSIDVGNVSQQLRDYVRQGVFRDRKVTIRLVSQIADIVSLQWNFQVAGTVMNAMQVSFTLGHVNLFQKPLPKNRFSRSRCRHIYRDPTCAYAGAMISCDKQLDSPNGCRAHGADEIASGDPQLHPNRYGGFPVIPNER